MCRDEIDVDVPVDQFFRGFADTSQPGDVETPIVLCDSHPGEQVGFYSVSVEAMNLEFKDDSVEKNSPSLMANVRKNRFGDR